MPKYKFVCKTCGKVAEEYTMVSVRKVTCTKCGSEANRKLPTINKTEVRETVDSLRNIKQKLDQKEIVQDRSDDHYWSVVVPRLVESGTYSEQTMLEKQWIYYDEKGHMQINTKPPSQR